MTISLFIKLNESLLLSAPSFLFIGMMEPRKLNNSTTNNSTIDTTNRSSTSNNNVIFILSICFILMVLTYISIIKIYCIHNNHKKINNKKINNKNNIEYEPLFNNYGTLEEF